MTGVLHFFKVHVYGWWGWMLPFQLWIQICVTYNDSLTGCNCLKLAALFKLKQLKTYQEIKSSELALTWNNKTPLIFLDCKWSGHILLWLCRGWPQVNFLKGKKSREHTYLLTVCQLKASTPRTKDHNIKCCTCTSNRLTRPQMHQPARSVISNRSTKHECKTVETVGRGWDSGCPGGMSGVVTYSADAAGTELPGAYFQVWRHRRQSVKMWGQLCFGDS